MEFEGKTKIVYDWFTVKGGGTISLRCRLNYYFMAIMIRFSLMDWNKCSGLVLDLCASVNLKPTLLLSYWNWLHSDRSLRIVRQSSSIFHACLYYLLLGAVIVKAVGKCIHTGNCGVKNYPTFYIIVSVMRWLESAFCEIVAIFGECPDFPFSRIYVSITRGNVFYLKISCDCELWQI